jgi:subtilisin family serine protease
VLAEVARDQRFARDVAEATSYVPNTIMATPLVDGRGQVSGVLELLDPAPGPEGSSRDLDRLSAIAAGLTALKQRRRRLAMPEWSAAFDADRLSSVAALPLPGPSVEWALAGSTGRGVKVAVVDSGVNAEHPRVGGLAGSVVIEADDSRTGHRVVEGPHADLVGHGTACAGIIRSLAPEAELYSVRVLGANLKSNGRLFAAALRWVIDAGMQVVNLSLSSRSPRWMGPLYALADEAYFHNVLFVCAANNVPGPTYPSQFASVVSVAAMAGNDPQAIAYNPSPPVEFGAPGIDLDVAWGDGTQIATGNSFAAPHVAGLAALVLGKHPELRAFQVKAVLQAICSNAMPVVSATEQSARSSGSKLSAAQPARPGTQGSGNEQF